MTSSTWKTILLPPLSALALYLLTSHILLPLYTRYIRNLQSYTPLPFSSPSGGSAGAISIDRHHLFDEFRMRVSDLLGRARRDSLNGGVEGFLGDEELEEGVGGFETVGGGRMGDGGGGNDGRGGEGGRLSRELEGGFMDDSSEEEDDDRGRRIQVTRG